MTVRVEDESVEYVERDDVVRFPRVRTGDEVLEYGTMSVERWVEFRATEAAKDAVREELEKRVNGKISGVAIGVGSTDDGATTAVKMYHQRWRNTDGTVTEPSVSFDRLKELTPEKIDVTAKYRDETDSCSVPVEMDSEEAEFL
ncbi:hypothetical protein [Haladaptatus paucihalophilus]|nr:hypothetical protein [Haladaptatus paucihalophilus]SHK50004.1 hypothetical protein SAMN05444342_1466 [Haladaptatus paucihalophilus DX253]